MESPRHDAGPQNSPEFFLQRDLLRCLEEEGYLEELAKTGSKYLEAVNEVRAKGMLGPPLYFRPELDLAKVSTISGELFKLFMGEPALAEVLLQQLVLHIFCECLGASRLPGGLQPEQIKTPLRISCESAEMLKTKNDKQGLLLIEGVLSSFTTSSKYIRSCVSCCKTEGCHGSAPKRYTGTFYKARLCHKCNCPEVEMSEERDVGEEVLATILPLNGLNVGMKGKSKAKMVIIRDDLAAGLQIGCNVQVVCRPVLIPRLPTPLTLMACSRLEPASTSGCLYRPIPSTLMNFYSQYGNSPWAAVAALALNVAQEIVPNGCLFNVRLGAVLSIASHGMHQPLHLLVTGQENVLASSIMESAAKLAPKSLTHGCQNALCGVVKKSEDARQDLWIEAGSLLLASQGICLVGDWNGLKRDTKSDICSAIERGTITIKLPNKPLEFPMRASVWTHCSRLDKKSMRPIIDVFGMPFTADVTEEENSLLAYYLLSRAVDDKPIDVESCLQDSDFKFLLSAVESKPVTMTENASRLIRNYFVASRRARAVGGSIEECLPIGAVQSMSTMAEGHARLSLRKEVIPEDALVAISLCEQSLVSLFGPAFQAPPIPPCGATLDITNVQQNVDEFMHATSRWLDSLIKALIGGE